MAQFGDLAKQTNTMILPAQVADTAAMIATAMNVIKDDRRPAAALTPRAGAAQASGVAAA